MGRERGDRARGVLSLLAMVAMLAGVPAVLVMVAGRPLPSSMPTWGAIVERITGRFSVDVLVDVIAVSCWLLWASFAAAVVAAVAARLRGLSAPSWRVPFGTAAARLVAGVSLLSVSSPTAAFARPAIPVVASVRDASPAPLTVVPTTSSPVPAGSAVVAEGETLPAFAHRVLGSEDAWRQVWDRNQGRTMVDGSVFTEPHRLRAGWVLAYADAEPVTHVVAPGESWWSIAQSTDPDGEVTMPMVRDLAAANGRDVRVAIHPGQVVTIRLPPAPAPGPSATREVVAGASWWSIASSAYPDEQITMPLVASLAAHNGRDVNEVIHPGDQVDVPALSELTGAPVLEDLEPPKEPASSPAPVPPPAVAAPIAPRELVRPDVIARPLPPPRVLLTAPTPSTIAPPVAPVPEPRTSPEMAGPARGSHDTVGKRVLIGGGALAAGLLAMLDQRRRRALAKRAPHTRMVPPPPGLVESERRLRAAGSPDLVERVAGELASLRTLAAGVPENAVPELVDYDERLITVLWTAPARPAPRPWEATDDGWTWRVLVDDETRPEWPPPVPLLTLGRRHSRVVMVNLETVGCLGVDGPPEQMDAFLRAAATEMASYMVADTRIALVGVDARVAGSLDRTDVVDLATAVEMARRARRCTDELLAEQATANTFRVRCAPHRTDLDALIVVVDAANQDASTISELVGLTTGGGVCVVMANAPIEVAARIVLADGGGRLEPHGVDLDEVNRLTAHEDEAVRGLLDHAEAAETVPASDGLATIPDAFLDDVVSTESGGSSLVVKVLCTPRVPDRPTAAPRTVELVALLALHPRGLTSEQLVDRLWGGEVPSESHRLNTISTARRTLGDLDGQPLMPRISAGAPYVLHPAVTTDLAQFRCLSAEADGAGPARAIELLSTALEMVEGRPFGEPGYEWCHPVLAAEAEQLVVDAAHRLAELTLAAGDLRAARFAVSQGLRVSPANESLHAARMRIAHAAGQTDVVRSTYSTLVRLLDQLGDEPSDETASLYVQLTTRVA